MTGRDMGEVPLVNAQKEFEKLSESSCMLMKKVCDEIESRKKK